MTLSKDEIIAGLRQVQEAVYKLKFTADTAIDYVGAANYEERIDTAHKKVEDAYGEISALTSIIAAVEATKEPTDDWLYESLQESKREVDGWKDWQRAAMGVQPSGR